MLIALHLFLTVFPNTILLHLLGMDMLMSFRNWDYDVVLAVRMIYLRRLTNEL